MRPQIIFMLSFLLTVPFFIGAIALDIEDLPGDVEEITSYWSFDEADGDLITNGVDGGDLVLGSIEDDDSSPELVEGIHSNGLHFDGGNGMAQVDEFQFPSTEFTLSFWIMTESMNEGEVPISYATIYEDNEFIVEDPGNLDLHIRGISKETGIALNDGIWHHVVITWEYVKGTLKVYKDTVMEFQGTLSLGTEIRTGGDLVLGNEQDEAGGGFDPEQAFNGTLDEMLFFNSLFDEDDVEDLFESVLEPPKVIEKEPDGGIWPVTAVVNVTFNVEMDKESFPDGFSIDPAVNGTFVWNETMVSFIPDEDLDHEIEYKVMITTDVEDLQGRSLIKAVEFKFKTEKDLDPEPGPDDDPGTDSDTDTDVDSDSDTDGDEDDDDIEKGSLVAVWIIGGVLLLLVVLIAIFAYISRNKEE